MNRCRPDCEICGGSGYFRIDVEVGHPFFGTVLECPNIRVAESRLWKRSGLQPEEFELDPKTMLDVNEMANVRPALEEVVARGHGFVYLWGDFGTGKTRFLKSLVAAWLRGRYEKRPSHAELARMLYHPTPDDVRSLLHQHGGAAYVKTSKLIEVMAKAEFNADHDNQARDIEFWVNCQLLVLDEFDKVRGTPYALERRFGLLDERYEQAMLKKSITVMAGNENPAETLEGYIYDRLKDKRSSVLWSGDKSFRPLAEE